MLTSDKNESISVSEYGIEVENDSSKQSIGFADIKDVEIVDGNVLQTQTSHPKNTNECTNKAVTQPLTSQTGRQN